MNTIIHCPNCGTAAAEITPVLGKPTPIVRQQEPGVVTEDAARQIARYLADRVDVAPGHKQPSVELRNDCTRWATDNGLEPLNLRTFGAGLRLNGIKQMKSQGVRYYLGVRLRP